MRLFENFKKKITNDNNFGGPNAYLLVDYIDNFEVISWSTRKKVILMMQAELDITRPTIIEINNYDHIDAERIMEIILAHAYISFREVAISVHSYTTYSLKWLLENYGPNKEAIDELNSYIDNAILNHKKYIA